MKPVTYLTTSWDDGHPQDLRIADLLTKYGLSGTFYVPKQAETPTMGARETRDLGRAFEIGAHTLHHIPLTEITDAQARDEIAGSRAWIEDLTGSRCLMFCPPKGKYRRRHLPLIRNAGYLGLRSVEVASLEYPRSGRFGLLLPTTVQAHRLSRFTIARNVAKRLAFRNLFRFVAHDQSVDWPALARRYLREALSHGGVFHLWGHSWELDDPTEWLRLEELLRFMSELRSEAVVVTNGELCRATWRVSDPTAADACDLEIAQMDVTS